MMQRDLHRLPLGVHFLEDLVPLFSGQGPIPCEHRRFFHLLYYSFHRASNRIRTCTRRIEAFGSSVKLQRLAPPCPAAFLFLTWRSYPMQHSNSNTIFVAAAGLAPTSSRLLCWLLLVVKRHRSLQGFVPRDGIEPPPVACKTTALPLDERGKMGARINTPGDLFQEIRFGRAPGRNRTCYILFTRQAHRQQCFKGKWGDIVPPVRTTPPA